MTDLTMPRLTDAMEEGTIVRWLVGDGDPVEVGDEVVEVETDKATTAVIAEHAGSLQVVEVEGATVPVGGVIARIGAANGASGAAPAVAQAPTAPPQAAAQPAPAPAPAEVGVPATVAANGVATASPAGNGGRSTPLARRIAAVHGVALDGIAGTGPRGRVTRFDVLRAAGIEPDPEPRPEAAPAAAAAAAPGPVPDGATLRAPTRLQQTIARRMSEQALVPVFQVQTDVRMDAALALRAELKRLAGDRPAPSVNDLIVRACALALRDHPLVNGSYRPDGFLVHDHVAVGIAVASDAGLLVATIPATDTKSLGQIADEARALAAKVRDGSVSPAELTGGTFTVSNLGMFGMTEITAVINPPQAAILGVGAARTVLARDPSGEVVEEQLVALNLTCDHRILNGADGARFLQDVKGLLEAPLRILL